MLLCKSYVSCKTLKSTPGFMSTTRHAAVRVQPSRVAKEGKRGAGPQHLQESISVCVCLESGWVLKDRVFPSSSIVCWVFDHRPLSNA